jgi:translation initiation factor 2 beta subunit (eIF-2beta)/eIF-5
MSDIWAYTEYLAKVRQENKELFSKCQECGKPATDIEADGYKIYPVCKAHINTHVEPKSNLE